MLPRPGLDPAARTAADEAFRNLNDSPVQCRLRADAETFNAVVLWPAEEFTPEDLRAECAKIAATGFTTIRLYNTGPIFNQDGSLAFWRFERALDAAHETGLNAVCTIPISKLPDAMLARHGMTQDEFDRRGLDEVTQPLLEPHLKAWLEHFRDHPALYGWCLPGGESHPVELDFSEAYEQERFAAWLRARYGTLEALQAAWTLYPKAVEPIPASFEEAWRVPATMVGEATINGVHNARVNYAATRDGARYIAGKRPAYLRALYALIRQYDDKHWIKVGNHQLFLNQPAFRWDSADAARAGDTHQTSLHLAWHFEAVGGELDRPVYMQARITRDWFKYGWTSAYETTGGAVQYSGGYPNSMSPGLMRRLLFNYLAAGNLALAFWTWNHRPGGWEQGEYGLVDLAGRPTPWAEETARIGAKLKAHARELWDASHRPLVGILQSWDTDMILSLEPNCHLLDEGVSTYARGTRMQHQMAQIGIARALIDAQIPFEYLTTAEAMEGILARYPVLYCPHLRAVDPALLPVLRAYVEAGGRLVADVQFAFCTHHGRVPVKGPDRVEGPLFGAWISMIHHSRTETRDVNGIPIDGFFGDLEPVEGGARVVLRFDDGRPAATEYRLGRGSAVLLGFDAARMCATPGRVALQSLLTGLIGAEPEMTWEAPLAFCLYGETADHVFLLNDEPTARTAILRRAPHRYKEAALVVEEKPLATDGTLAVPLAPESGAWVRLVHA